MKKQLGLLEADVIRGIKWHHQQCTMDRLFDHDITLWNGTGAPGEEIVNRLGWLNLPYESEDLIPALDSLFDQLVQQRYLTAVLLGMGGSSLAPYVIAETLAGFDLHPSNALRLFVLDSTSPDEIASVRNRIDLQTTIFIVSSKSGTTLETQVLCDYFWNLLIQSGMDQPGQHFIAITDPGSKLIEEARQRHYRAVFTANPNVGGRFSALSIFGLLPARLCGVDLSTFLHSAQEAQKVCCQSSSIDGNPGLLLGAAMAEAQLKGIDKVIIVADSPVSTFGIWAEQLIAESSGKMGKGIIPVAMEPGLSVKSCSSDRLFIHLRSSNEQDGLIDELAEAGHPCLVMNVDVFCDLAVQFYLWEIAVAVACSQLGVNAFDQPNVQESKTLTKSKIEQICQNGKLAQEKPDYSNEDLDIFLKNSPIPNVDAPESIFDAFLSQIHPGDYLAINAFISAEPAHQNVMQGLREKVTHHFKIATTLGYGPRFLHSTGQLHKGGPDKGLYLVITQDSHQIMGIPGRNISFNQLILAQAAGDIEALAARGRRILHIHFKNPDRLSTILDQII